MAHHRLDTRSENHGWATSSWDMRTLRQQASPSKLATEKLGAKNEYQVRGIFFVAPARRMNVLGNCFPAFVRHPWV